MGAAKGSDEPAHPRKIGTYTMKMHAVAVNLKPAKPLRWSGHLGIRFIYHKSVEVCTPTLLHAKISLRTAQSYQHLCFKNKTLNILTQNCLLN